MTVPAVSPVPSSAGPPRKPPTRTTPANPLLRPRVVMRIGAARRRPRGIGPPPRGERGRADHGRGPGEPGGSRARPCGAAASRARRATGSGPRRSRDSSRGERSAGMSTPNLVEIFYARVWNAGDLAAVPELVTEDFSFRGSLGTRTH